MSQGLDLNIICSRARPLQGVFPPFLLQFNKQSLPLLNLTMCCQALRVSILCCLKSDCRKIQHNYRKSDCRFIFGRYRVPFRPWVLPAFSSKYVCRDCGKSLLYSNLTVKKSINIKTEHIRKHVAAGRALAVISSCTLEIWVLNV